MDLLDVTTKLPEVTEALHFTTWNKDIGPKLIASMEEYTATWREQVYERGVIKPDKPGSLDEDDVLAILTDVRVCKVQPDSAIRVIAFTMAGHGIIPWD
ncbi:hypothetical protein BM221_010811 [Beauveria bassiana]|uniref:Uncharacterized protein n=1 Tax=Beauveria bassiana TaxID=176275 RepID=A0A2N6N7T9_BEABA|nr:hypothetical protein BM221_010811 [Beauveria bassiana]